MVILSLVAFTNIQIWLFLILKMDAFLIGDFNINLLNYNDHQPTNDYLPLTLLFYMSYIQPELLVIQKLSLTIYFPILPLLK